MPQRRPGDKTLLDQVCLVSLGGVPAPEPAAAARADLDRLVRRLRGLTARAWRSEGRAETVQRLIVDLAAAGAPGREPPQVPDHARAEAVAVLGHDALNRPDQVVLVHHLIREALEATGSR